MDPESRPLKRRNPAPYLFCVSLLAVGGCGALPEFVVESARSAAQAAIEDAVADWVDDAFDRALNEAGEVLPPPLSDESESLPE